MKARYLQRLLFGLFLCAAIAVHSASLLGQWSSLVTVYPNSAPFNAARPSIALDANGNAIAVWFDTTGSGSLRAATLVQGAVDASGQPAWVLTSPIVTSNVQTPSSPYAQGVGVDAAGNATAVWTDGIRVYASTLPFGDSLWSPPIPINNPIVNEVITNLCIGVGINGNAVATWSSSVHPYDATILANVFDPKVQLWLGQMNLLGDAVEFDLSVNPVAVDPQGNAIVATTVTSNLTQAIRYNAQLNTWTRIPGIWMGAVVSESCAIDAHGNAVIVWTDISNMVRSATLPLAPLQPCGTTSSRHALPASR